MRSSLALQQSCDLVAAEETLRDRAFWTDVRPAVKEWRQARKLPAEPLKALKGKWLCWRLNQPLNVAQRNAKSVSSYA